MRTAYSWMVRFIRSAPRTRVRPRGSLCSPCSTRCRTSRTCPCTLRRPSSQYHESGRNSGWLSVLGGPFSHSSTCPPSTPAQGRGRGLEGTRLLGGRGRCGFDVRDGFGLGQFLLGEFDLVIPVQFRCGHFVAFRWLPE